MYNVSESDYKFVERPEDDFYTIELTSGIWEGTKYQYGKVQAKIDEVNDDEDGIATLSFMWSLIEGDESLTESPDFQDYIGAVLQHILQDAFDTGNYKIGNNDDAELTDNDSEESTDQ